METQDCRGLKASIHKALKVMGAMDCFRAQLAANMSINIFKTAPPKYMHFKKSMHSGLEGALFSKSGLIDDNL